MIALDTETFAWVNRPGWKAPPLVCISLSDGTEVGTFVIHRNDDWHPVVRRALAIGVVGHHVAFDMCVLAAAGFPLEEIFDAYEQDKITCTMIREKLLDIYTGDMGFRRKQKGAYRLDTLVKRRLDIEMSKETSVRLEYESLANVPVTQWPPAFRLYAANDALLTHRLASAQNGAAGASNFTDQYRQARGAFWLNLMSTWGTCVDLPRLDGLAREYSDKYAAAGRDLVASGLARVVTKKGVPGLVKNEKIARGRLVQAYALQGLDFPKTETGQAELSREACENARDPSLLRYSEYQALGSKVNKDIPALNHAQIHAYYDPLVETGRTACGEPNLQNLPRKGGFRQCLIPRPGNVFISADFSMFELATLAQCCIAMVGFSRLAEALNDGLDPHSMIAADISGWTYDRILEVYKGDESHPDFGQVYDWRQTGKAANFGFPGGMGIERWQHTAQQQYGVALSRADAERIKYQIWSPKWPEMPHYFKKIDQAVGQYGYIEQLYSGRVRGRVSYCDACNGMFQGLAADIMKDAGFRLSRECYLGSMRGARIVNEVHDEYVIETPEAKARDDAKIIKKICVESAAKWLPDVRLGVDVKVSRRYKGDYL